MVVEVLQRKPGEFQVDVAPQRVDRALGDSGHDEPLQPAEERAEQVHRREQDEDPRERLKVHADTGREAGLGDHLGELGLALRVEPGDRRLGRRAGRELLADDAGEQHVRRLSQDPWAGDAEGDADDRHHHHEDDLGAFRLECGQQSQAGLLEVARLGDRRAVHAAAGTESSAAALFALSGVLVLLASVTRSPPGKAASTRSRDTSPNSPSAHRGYRYLRWSRSP